MVNISTSVDGVSDADLSPAWDGTPANMFGYGTADVQFTGISGGDSYVVQGSLAGVTYKAVSGTNYGDLTTLASITADGIYSYPGVGFLRYVKTGSASTPVVDLLLKR